MNHSVPIRFNKYDKGNGDKRNGVGGSYPEYHNDHLLNSPPQIKPQPDPTSEYDNPNNSSE